MADRAHSTMSRRALLAAPAALAALPAAAVPTAGDSCLALGLKLGRTIKAYQVVAHHGVDSLEEDRLYDAVQVAGRAVLEAPVHSIGDVAAKLVMVLERVNWASEGAEDREPCSDAAAALRQCLMALPALTGIRLAAFGADFVDIELSRAIDRGQA